MDNSAIKEEVKEGELVSGNFPLALQPLDLQITIHVNNLINTYGSKAIVKEFKTLLNDPPLIEESRFGSLVIRQIIRYYGISKMREWFTLIYGWQFEDISWYEEVI